MWIGIRLQIYNPWRVFIAMDKLKKSTFIDFWRTPHAPPPQHWRVSTGMMDEKIYQRQITKQSLADSFMVPPLEMMGVWQWDGKGSSGNSFTLEELRNLFSYNETVCETHSLLDCPCNGNGVLVDKALLSDDADFDLPGFLPASQYTETKVPRTSQSELMNRRNINLMRCMSIGISIRGDGRKDMVKMNISVISLKILFYER